jgi:hypothetical protein
MPIRSASSTSSSSASCPGGGQRDFGLDGSLKTSNRPAFPEASIARPSQHGALTQWMGQRGGSDPIHERAPRRISQRTTWLALLRPLRQSERPKVSLQTCVLQKYGRGVTANPALHVRFTLHGEAY